MKESFRKIALIFMFSLAMSFSFSQDWYVCLGSYDDFTDAKMIKENLELTGIPVFMKDFLEYGGERTYRLFYSETLETKENALLLRKSLIEKPEVTRIVSRDSIWITALPSNKETRRVEIKEIAPPPPEPEPEPEIEMEPELLPPSRIVPKQFINVRDSDTGDPVENANVKIDKKIDAVTDKEGNALVPSTLRDGEHNILVTKGDEYVPTTGAFILTEGEISSGKQISIPRKVDYSRIKIVLDWGKSPQDLDAHAYAGRKHVFFGHRKSKNLELDRDDRDSYGPETVTIKNPVATETYSYYVNNFINSGDAKSKHLSNSGSQVSLFFGNEFVKSFTITPDQVGSWWHVFDIVNGNQIVEVNTVSNSRKEKQK